MRGHDELMERLAAADPVRDREPLTSETQREADAMLARLLATPVTEPRRSRSRVRPRARPWSTARWRPCREAASTTSSSA